MPELIIIAAVAEKNRVIGKGNDLPWHIPEDLKRFKALTSGHPMLMGRRTFESIIHQFGRPLPNRRHVVVTSHGPLPDFPEIETYPSIDAALKALEDEDTVYVAGGATIYRQMLHRVDAMELTLVEGDYEGDAFFPPFEHLVGSHFQVVAEEPRDGIRFVTYRRKV